jgi:putative phosphoserine phosphatase/1-acylglycerol-3-phosphate O-acyltransferase
MSTIDSAPAGPRVGAFFDFDGTLIDGYSAMVFLQDRWRRGDLPAGELARLVRTFVDAKRGHATFDEFMRIGVQAFRGTDVGDLDDLAKSLLTGTLGGRLFAGAAALVRAHQARGHTVVIATSALPFQAAGLAAELGVEHVLCTQLEAREGILTGRIDGPVLWGPGKAAAVRAFAQEHDLDLAECFGYGNGDEDLDFLRTVGRPSPINPEDGLAEVATREGWEVHRFEGRGSPGLRALAGTAAAYTGVAVAFGAALGVGLVTRDRRRAANTVVQLTGDLPLALAGVSLDVRGEEHLWSHRPAVFIFNHTSILDGFVVMKLLRRDITGVAKKEVASQPLFGQIAQLTQMAMIDRTDSASAVKALEPVVQRLREGYSIALSPEGTRAPTTKLLPFKKGAFHMAMQGGVPIVPMVFRNVGERQWRTEKTIRPGTIDVVVHPPVPTDDWTVDTLDDHVADVRGLFEATLADWPA